ncbi:MAG TPA: threonine--tRNA ligase, partial [Anaerolineae bacterium]|nr:threonine--tRNA ligase [Anaerolineae bacterium]
VIELVKHMLETMGMSDFQARLGVNDPDSGKYMGSPVIWERGIEAIKQAADRIGMSYTIEVGEAAFYGPKLDFVVRDVLKREWQLGTIQVDFNLPERFDIEYIGADGEAHRPIMIHRAPFGSMERFVGILIEHFNGAFPLWMSPLQVMMIPIADRHIEYAESVAKQLRDAGMRVKVDAGSDRMNKKIRNAQLQKTPFMLVVGDKEAEAGQVSVRTRNNENRGSQSVAEFMAHAATLIATHSLAL